jgi:hypothetical protein
MFLACLAKVQVSYHLNLAFLHFNSFLWIHLANLYWLYLWFMIFTPIRYSTWLPESIMEFDWLNHQTLLFGKLLSGWRLNLVWMILDLFLTKLLYCFTSVRPFKIFFVAFFSVTVDGRNLIFGHKRHIGIPYCG